MKTQLKPVSPQLAAVLGKKDSSRRYISISKTARPTVRARVTHTTLAQIEAALNRLELGTFGLCNLCGDKICLKRLDADPCVRNCEGCEEGDATAR